MYVGVGIGVGVSLCVCVCVCGCVDGYVSWCMRVCKNDITHVCFPGLGGSGEYKEDKVCLSIFYLSVRMFVLELSAVCQQRCG